MASNLFDCPFALLSAHGILRQQLISRFRISSSLHSLSPDSTTIRPTILPSRVKRPIIVSFGRGTYGDGIIVSSFPEESVVSFRVIGPFNTLYSLRFFFFLCPLEQGGGGGGGVIQFEVCVFRWGEVGRDTYRGDYRYCTNVPLYQPVA